MDKVDHTNTNAKRARMATLITDKVSFRAMKVTRDKDRHHTTMKVLIHKADPSLCMQLATVSKHVKKKHIVLKGELEKPTVTALIFLSQELIE